tara:strand:+ start:126 stop:638 length:513 start_codon:yes stop_codon:yes gene_type:complete
MELALLRLASQREGVFGEGLGLEGCIHRGELLHQMTLTQRCRMRLVNGCGCVVLLRRGARCCGRGGRSSGGKLLAKREDLEITTLTLRTTSMLTRAETLTLSLHSAKDRLELFDSRRESVALGGERAKGSVAGGEIDGGQLVLPQQLGHAALKGRVLPTQVARGIAVENG